MRSLGLRKSFKITLFEFSSINAFGKDPQINLLKSFLSRTGLVNDSRAFDKILSFDATNGNRNNWISSFLFFFLE